MSTPVEQFYLRDLTTRPPGGTTPVSEFLSTQQIELSWQSTGTNFTVYAANDPAPVWTGDAQSCVIPPRTANTTFIVAASVTGGPNSGTPGSGYQTIYLYDSISVTIADPTLTPSSVVTDSLTVTDSITVTGSTTADDLTISGVLTVTETAILNGGAKATGLTVNGNSHLQGDAVISSATVGNVTVTGQSTLAAAVADTLTVHDTVTMMSPSTIQAGKTYQANSDGLLVGGVSYPSDPSKYCSTIIGGWSKSLGWVFATGGNTAITTDAMWGVANTFTLPVRAKETFTTSVTAAPDNAVPTGTWFYWIAFGLNAPLTEVSAADVAALGIEKPAIPPPIKQEFDVDTPIAQLVATLIEMAGADQPASTRDELIRTITALANHEA